MAIFKGAGVAIVTPMKADGEVNYDVLGEMLEAQIREVPMPSSSAAPQVSLQPSQKRSIPL